jgi:oxygen-independent coproporphyrinogen-3 oxidase
VVPLGDGPPSKRLREFRNLRHRGYLHALDKELAALPDGFTPETLYLGGGTPTELSPEDLTVLFTSIRKHLDLSKLKEFSCEANPGTLDPTMVALLASQGVNRVSLGVQSFSDDVLESLGRIHNADEARKAVHDLRNAGISNLSIDLLFGLPSTPLDTMELNLLALQELKPDHVSWYSLEFEAGTPFTEMRDKGFITEPDDEQTAAEYLHIRTGLARQGFEQYELFSFARPGAECLHNTRYWTGGEYFGCGPSAHWHVDGKRGFNAPNLTTYETQSPGTSPETEQLDPDAKAREGLMTALRLTQGVDCVNFKERHGYSPEEVMGSSYRVWIDAGWLEAVNNRVRLTPEAYLISDSLFREFI